MSTKLVALGPPATIAQVLERIAAMDSLPSQKRHDLMSAVRRVARLLDSLPADIPADPEALKRRLGILPPAAAGMTRGRWMNVRALLTTALALTGAKVMRGRRRDALAPEWLALLERVSDRYERARLSRFFSYASANGIKPNDVDDRTVADFAESLKRNSLLEHQTEIVRGFCLAWNRCAEKIEGWPAARVTVPNRRRDYALPPTTYPPSFVADVKAYIAHLAGGDLFNATGRGPASPATLRDLRVRLFEMAAALVHSGRAPETIGSLADLVAPNALQTALTFVWSRNGKRKTGGGFRREVQPRRQHWFLNEKSGFPFRTPAFCSISRGQRRLGEKEYRAPSVTPGVALRVRTQGASPQFCADRVEDCQILGQGAVRTDCGAAGNPPSS